MLVTSIQFLYLLTAFTEVVFPFSFLYFVYDELCAFLPAGKVSSSTSDVLSLFNILKLPAPYLVSWYKKLLIA
jgi:hypothetical protein